MDYDTKTARKALAAMRSNLVSQLASMVLKRGKTSDGLQRKKLTPVEPPPISIWSNGQVLCLITSASIGESNLLIEIEQGNPSAMAAVGEEWLNELPIEDLIAIVAAFEPGGQARR